MRPVVAVPFAVIALPLFASLAQVGCSPQPAADPGVGSEPPGEAGPSDAGAPDAAPLERDASSEDAGREGDDGGGTPPGAYPDDPEILELIENMGDNTSLELPPYGLGGDRVDEWVELNGRAPQRRDYCNKLVFAPERVTGMYAGMNHGAPHKLNDAWEYHLGSNTWYLLYFPYERSRPEDWFAEHAMIEDGYLQSTRHGMVQGLHTWDGLAYDPVARTMLWANPSESSTFGTGSGSWAGKTALELYAEAQGRTLDEVEAELLPGTRVWKYHAEGGRWHRQMGDGPRPAVRMVGGSMEYITHLGKTVWYANQWNEAGMWTYDSATETWEDLEPNDGISPYHNPDTFPRAEAQIRYSEAHRKLVAVLGTFTYEYDFATNAWSRTNDDEANDGHDARTVFVYDEINDVFLLLQPRLGTLRAYRVETKAWETLTPVGDELRGGKTAGYFDPVHNVMVVYDSSNDTTWLYRYRRS